MQPIAVFPLKCRNTPRPLTLLVLPGEGFALQVGAAAATRPEDCVAYEDSPDHGIRPDTDGSVYAKFVQFASIRATAIRSDRFFCGDGVRLDGGDRGVVYLVWKGLGAIKAGGRLSEGVRKNRSI